MASAPDRPQLKLLGIRLDLVQTPVLTHDE
jgi:hypothetical protein